MGRRIATALIAVSFIGVLAGCGQATNGRAPLGDLPSSSTVGSSGPSQAYPLPSGGDKSPQAGDLTLTGQVEAGVEPGCLLMKQGSQTYLLMSGDPAVVKAGASVVVTGHVTTGIMSYCQQGQPFTVTSAKPR